MTIPSILKIYVGTDYKLLQYSGKINNIILVIIIITIVLAAIITMTILQY